MLDSARLQLILIAPPARFPSGCNLALWICFWDYCLWGGGGGADLGNIHCLGGALSFLPSTTDSALKPRREAEGSASPHKWEEGARWLAGWEESREKEGVLWEGSGKPKIWAHSEHQVLEVLSAVLCSQFRRTLPEFPGRLSVPLGADCHLDQTPGELSSEACLAVLN